MTMSSKNLPTVIVGQTAYLDSNVASAIAMDDTGAESDAHDRLL